MGKTKKRRRSRICNCWECQQGRKDLKKILDKNRLFITLATRKILIYHSKKLLQIRMFIDVQNMKRKGRKDGK